MNRAHPLESSWLDRVVGGGVIDSVRDFWSGSCRVKSNKLHFAADVGGMTMIPGGVLASLKKPRLGGAMAIGGVLTSTIGSDALGAWYRWKNGCEQK